MDKKLTKTVGSLYVLGFVVGIAGSILGTPGPLETVGARSAAISLGALLWVLAAAGDAAHGVLMYPLLKASGERVALGYFGARLVEAAVVAISALFTLLQIPLGAQLLTASPAEAARHHALSALLVSAQIYTYQIGMLALAAAGLTLAYGLLKAHLLPRPLVLWGFVGYVSFLFGSALEVMGHNLQLLHTLPGGLWELFTGVWLIVRGFSPSEPRDTLAT